VDELAVDKDNHVFSQAALVINDVALERLIGLEDSVERLFL